MGAIGTKDGIAEGAGSAERRESRKENAFDCCDLEWGVEDVEGSSRVGDAGYPLALTDLGGGRGCWVCGSRIRCRRIAGGACRGVGRRGRIGCAGRGRRRGVVGRRRGRGTKARRRRGRGCAGTKVWRHGGTEWIGSASQKQCTGALERRHTGGERRY